MKPSRRFAAILLLLDGIAFIGVFYLAAYVRGLFSVNPYALTDLIFPFGLLVTALYLIDGYKPRTDMMGLDYTSQHFIAITAAAACLLLTTFVFITKGITLHSSRAVLMTSFAMLSALTLSYRRVLYHRYLRKRGNQSIVFVGAPEHCIQFRQEYERNGMLQPLILCAVPGEEHSSHSERLPAKLCTMEQVLNDSRSGNVQIEAIVLRESGRDLPSPVSQQLVGLYFAGIPTYTLELFHQVYWRKIPIYRLNQTWLFQEGFKIAREPVFERIKRIVDILLATVGVTLFGPVILISAVAIWIEDRANPFFTQTRIGQNHIPFTIYKLRSMRPGAATKDPYTRDGDSRITRVGKFLRETRIDELPQLWNVLSGDMSLIGPRAEWDRLVTEYEEKIPCYHFRHLVKPGITGWAQVNYPYGANLDDTIRKLEYDLYYVKHFSFMLDAAIVLKTVHIMIFGKGR